MENYDNVLNSLESLISLAHGRGRSATVARKFLVSVWNDRPFHISELSALDNANTAHAKSIINYWIDCNFCFHRDFAYADELRSLCEQEAAI